MPLPEKLFTTAAPSKYPLPPVRKLWEGDDTTADRATRCASLAILRSPRGGNDREDWRNPNIWKILHGDAGGNDLVRPTRYTNNANITKLGKLFAKTSHPQALVVVSINSVVVFAAHNDGAGRLACRTMIFDCKAGALVSQGGYCTNDVYVENLSLCVVEIEKAWLPPCCNTGRVPLGARILDLSDVTFANGSLLKDCDNLSLWMPPYNVNKRSSFRAQRSPTETPHDAFPVEAIRQLAAGIATPFLTEYRDDTRRASDRLAYDAFVEHELPYPPGGAEVAQLLCFEVIYSADLNHDQALSTLEVRLKEMDEVAVQGEYLGEVTIIGVEEVPKKVQPLKPAGAVANATTIPPAGEKQADEPADGPQVTTKRNKRNKRF